MQSIKYLVVGDPISHSRSPNMQNAAFEACGLGRPYGIRRVLPEELPEFFEYARTHLSGVNLTVPHKNQAALLADSLTERAKMCGSVNTLIIKNGHITGDSTDGIGLQRALEVNFGISLAGRKILFLGSGGAARATSIHLGCCGCSEIVIANRTLEKARELAEQAQRAAPNTRYHVISISDKDAVQQALAESSVVIQATSLGLKDDDPPPIDTGLLVSRKDLYIFDTIYRRTALLERAAALGIPCAGGKEMLIYQGAASFESWTGLSAPVEAMREGFELPPGGVAG